MDENKEQPVEEQATGIPLDPEGRAFTGHPDHPPASPDQPVDGNQELLRRVEDDEQPQEAGTAKD